MLIVELDHPRIGRIRGIQRADNVKQFLGIQYATLKDRFSRGTLREFTRAQAPSEVLEATGVGLVQYRDSGLTAIFCEIVTLTRGGN